MSVRPFVMLMALAVGAASCGDGGGSGDASSTRIPTIADLVGTYDVTVASRDIVQSTASVGAVFANGTELGITLPGLGVAVHGTPAVDGRVTLEGMTTNSDAIRFVHGSASIEKESRTLRITGSLDVFGSSAFDMQRPIDADVRPFAGRFRLTFTRSPGVCDCATTVDVVLAVLADGTGELSATTEVDAAGTTVGALAGTSILISPNGLFATTTSYETGPNHGCAVAAVVSGDPCILSIDGRLPVAEGDESIAQFVLTDSLTLTVEIGTVAIGRVPRQ